MWTALRSSGWLWSGALSARGAKKIPLPFHPAPWPVRFLAVATMFCVDLVAAVRRKLESMAKDRHDARTLRWANGLVRTLSKRLSKPPSQKEIESNLSKQSREVQPRPAPSLRPPCALRPGPWAPHPTRALCALARPLALSHVPCAMQPSPPPLLPSPTAQPNSTAITASHTAAHTTATSTALTAAIATAPPQSSPHTAALTAARTAARTAALTAALTAARTAALTAARTAALTAACTAARTAARTAAAGERWRSG